MHRSIHSENGETHGCYNNEPHELHTCVMATCNVTWTVGDDV